ncbi:hypothetical protein [Chryseobacterium scophthalmum]|uniref:Uncharacterized protein n=1 Tax=Chryseobacterium scophthalmum TaxID=59733 RepID=A0A1N6HKB6_9FLAO|nr:hypothetical protein [Chryseobacterium scophthalmum]SIO20139.1 hypothetical protein SAMN05421769_2597 [Chryseobacterium scophthalmum]
MKIFPSSIYEFKLNDSKEKTLERLKRRTETSEKSISTFIDKSFTGNINQNKFQLFLSNIGGGSFCKLTGFLDDSEGEVLVEIKRNFKMLLCVLYFLPILGLIIELISNSKAFHLILLLVCPLQILAIRFIFIGVFFKVSSRQVLARFSDVLDAGAMIKK